MTRPLLWLAAGFALLALTVVAFAPPSLRLTSLLLPLGAAVPVALVLGGIAVARRLRDRDDTTPTSRGADHG